MKSRNEIPGLGSAAKLQSRNEGTGTTNMLAVAPNGQVINRAATNYRSATDTRCSNLGGFISRGVSQQTIQEEIPFGNGFVVFINTTTDEESALRAAQEAVDLAREECGDCDPDRNRCTPPEERTDV